MWDLFFVGERAGPDFHNGSRQGGTPVQPVHFGPHGTTPTAISGWSPRYVNWNGHPKETLLCLADLLCSDTMHLPQQLAASIIHAADETSVTT
jgi:hypothetical protein